MKAPCRLWLTADRQRAVLDGHPDAAFLLAGAEGADIPDPEARRLGLLTDQGPMPVEKALRGPAEDKALHGPAETKAVEAAPEVKRTRSTRARRR